MYEVLRELLFPYGIGQLICLIVLLVTICAIPLLIGNIRRTWAEKEKRVAKCRELLKHSYEATPDEDPYGANWRVHDIR